MTKRHHSRKNALLRRHKKSHFLVSSPRASYDPQNRILTKARARWAFVMKGFGILALKFGKLVVIALSCVIGAMAAGPAWAADISNFSKAWKISGRALVIDAYEYNSIDWNAIKENKRVAGFISKGSDGLPPPYYCSGNPTEMRLCKALWKRYSVARELYHTRKTVAKAIGLKWGVYHLGRPGNPMAQADHLIDFAEPEKDDLIAIDIEGHDPAQWMSLEDAEVFAQRINARLGRYPVLYTNAWTARYIATHRFRYKLLSRLPIWYARYQPSIEKDFPRGHWKNYALWQFTSHINCHRKHCPMRIKGTPDDIDINVAPYTVAELKRAWPLSGLVAKSAPDVVVAGTTYEPVLDGVVPMPISRSEGLKGPVEVAFADLIDESARNRIIEVYRQAAIRPPKAKLETASIIDHMAAATTLGDDAVSAGPHRLSLGVTVTSFAEENLTDKRIATAYRALLAGRKSSDVPAVPASGISARGETVEETATGLHPQDAVAAIAFLAPR
jgi:GH25 family lysozyme M1 (1,4-beta-N-acetylmuramidase)